MPGESPPHEAWLLDSLAQAAEFNDSLLQQVLVATPRKLYLWEQTSKFPISTIIGADIVAKTVPDGQAFR